MANQPVDSSQQEIDLNTVYNGFAVVGKRISGFFSHLFSIVLRYKFIILGLFLLGAALGYYLDKTSKVYENRLYVKPNFDSVDYLYDQVELLNAKLKEGDTVFLSKIGLQKKELFSIEIEPVIDVYKFVSANASHYDLIKLFAEDGDLNKVVKDNNTSKYYQVHSIVFKSIQGNLTDSTVQDLMKYFNSSEYFITSGKVIVQNYKNRIELIDQTVLQINGVLESMKVGEPNRSSAVTINDNSNIAELVQRKVDLIKEKEYLLTVLFDTDATVKAVSSSLNIRDFSGLNNKKKLVFPFVFASLFVLVMLFKKKR